MAHVLRLADDVHSRPHSRSCRRGWRQVSRLAFPVSTWTQMRARKKNKKVFCILAFSCLCLFFHLFKDSLSICEVPGTSLGTASPKVNESLFPLS